MYWYIMAIIIVMIIIMIIIIIVAMMMVISRTASGLLARQRCSAVIIQIVMIMGMYYVCLFIYIYVW